MLVVFSNVEQFLNKPVLTEDFCCEGDWYELITWSRDKQLLKWKYECASKDRTVEMLEPQSVGELVNNNLTLHNIKQIKNNGATLQLEQSVDSAPEYSSSSSSENEDGLNRLVTRVKSRVDNESQTSNALQNEFKYMSEIQEVDVEQDLESRTCTATLSCGAKNEHRVRLIMSFPLNYPSQEAPKFEFDKYLTSIDSNMQKELLKELQAEAQSRTNRNRACIEPCIDKLKELVSTHQTKISSQTDYKNGVTNKPLYDSSIPSPRSCGAIFCNDIFITFQRSIQPVIGEKTPRTLADFKAHKSSQSKRGYFPNKHSPISESVYQQQFYKRSKNKSSRKQQEKGGSVVIYQATQLLPINKHLALQYQLKPCKETCVKNAQAALTHRRADLHQIWFILSELVDSKYTDQLNEYENKPLASLPIGRKMIQNILEHYSRIGDIQTLAMIVSMFPLPRSTTCITPLELHQKLITSQYSRLEGRLDMTSRHDSTRYQSGTSPARSISSRSPPDRHTSIEPLTQNSLLNLSTNQSATSTEGPAPSQWNFTSNMKGRRNENNPGFLQDFRNQQTLAEDESNRKNAALMLDPSKSRLYDYYKEQYSNILYRWGFFNLRCKILHSLPNQSEHPDKAHSVSVWCGKCDLRGRDCSCTLRCALCRNRVRGVSSMCVECGHGGHTQHIRHWFSNHEQCATGCGCSCLNFNSRD